MKVKHHDGPPPAGPVDETAPSSRRDRRDQRRRGRRRGRLAVVVSVLLVAAIVAVAAVVVLYKQREGVVNSSANSGLAGWDARADVGPIQLRTTHFDQAPEGFSSGVELRRAADEQRAWARAIISLKDPTGFLRVGQGYRARVFVRDVTASGQTVGLLLGNENFEHRPTLEARYVSLDDDQWHELVLDFICTKPAAADTGIYLALPTSGPINLHITGVSLQQSDLAVPPTVDGQASRVLDFSGAAGAAPDPTVWNHEVGGGGWGNNELQTHTASRRNSALDGRGQLRITAREEDLTGPDGIPRKYTSARLTSKDKVEVPPGSYVEAPIIAPVGKGVWPAFWLLGSNIDEVGWPACGELDILEVVGSNPGTVHNAIHTAAVDDPKKDMPYGNGDEGGGSTKLRMPVDSRSHRYGVYFDKDLIVFYIDQQPTLTYTAAAARASGRTWPFDKDQFIILNVAVGGRESPEGTPFPRVMQVGAISIWDGGVPFG